MPAFQVMFEALNERLRHDRIGELDPAAFAEGQSLAGLLPEGAERLAFALDALPSALHEAIRAVLRDAVVRGMPVTLAWAPGYDYKLTLWDVADTTDTHGGITLLVETRYPADAHPIHGRMDAALDRD